MRSIGVWNKQFGTGDVKKSGKRSHVWAEWMSRTGCVPSLRCDAFPKVETVFFSWKCTTIRQHSWLWAGHVTVTTNTLLVCKVRIFLSSLLTPPATAERSVAAALRIWSTPRGFLYFYFIFFSPRFSPKVLNRWVWNLATMRGLGPKEIIKTFIAIAFIVF